MSYNGSGTFNINSSGQPVVTGTVITATAFNALTADLGTGLSTAITKDGQTTPTANIPLGTFKITGLGAGTAATDAVRMSQLQAGGETSIITVSGTDTITGTVSPTLTAYATGQQFSFVVAATNTTAVTLNVDSVGAKAVTRTGSIALVAGDMIIGQVVIVEYDGTRFQLINGNNLRVAGTTSGIATIVTPAAAGTPTLTLPTSTDTLVGRATTDTLTNKTLTSPVIAAITNSGTLTLPTLTGTVGLATRTVQVFTSGSGTYTTPTGCKAIQIELVGAGASGGSPSTGAGNGGGSVTFSTLTGTGGSAGGTATTGGGAGGAASGGDVNIPGGAGDASGNSNGTVGPAGGNGGGSYFGGSGRGGDTNMNTDASAGATNSGAGGGGAANSGNGASSGGGGSGGYVRKLISSPAATYSYAVGAGGAAVGPAGFVSGAGAAGIIIVTESY